MDALDPEDPRSAGPYRLIARLGAGGMGRVYLGRSERGRMVAVKIVHPELARDHGFRRRFRHEIDSARRVGGEWTAAVLDADPDSATPWAATAYVPGPSVQEVVDLHGPLPEPSVRALAAGLARALRAVQAGNLIHRDLKPSNVLVTIDGPRLIDFGIARSADAGLGTRTGAVVGSPGFMSPEQVRGTPLTSASDVFSLGAVLAFAATGRPPFGDGGVHARMFRIVSGPADLDGLDGPVRDLVERCLAKEPEERPALDELLADVLAEPPDGAWLPAGVTAELGRRAAELLEIEDPDAEPPPTAPPSTAPAPTVHATAVTTAGPPLADTRGVSPRRRGRRFSLGVGAAAVVIAAGLVFGLLQARGGADAPGGVPAGLVGTWEGWADGVQGTASRLRRITVWRGGAGERVAVARTAGSNALCEYEGVLAEGGTTVRLDMRLARAVPGGCVDRMEVSLAPAGGKVRWTSPGPAEVLSPAGNTAVPERLRGVWQWAGDAGPGRRTVELGSGDVGTAAATVAAPGPDGPCRAEAMLVSAEEKIVIFSGRRLSGRCGLDGLQTLERQDAGLVYWKSITTGAGGPLRQYID